MIKSNYRTLYFRDL